MPIPVFFRTCFCCRTFIYINYKLLKKYYWEEHMDKTYSFFKLQVMRLRYTKLYDIMSSVTNNWLNFLKNKSLCFKIITDFFFKRSLPTRVNFIPKNVVLLWNQTSLHSLQKCSWLIEFEISLSLFFNVDDLKILFSRWTK